MFVLAELLVLVIGGALMLAFYFCALLWTLAVLLGRGIGWLGREVRWRLGARGRVRELAAASYPSPRRARPRDPRAGVTVMPLRTLRADVPPIPPGESDEEF